MSDATLGGRFTFSGTSLTVQRIGYGAMQLAGPGVWGPPKDPHGAVAILREAVAAGVNHIDTSRLLRPGRYQPDHSTSPHPYPAELVIVTKIGARRPPDKSWRPAISPEDLIADVYDNLRNLGLDALDIVNYRVLGSGHGPEEGSLAEQVTVLADLGRQGLIRYIGLSNVTAAQVAEAQAITDIVCVQNSYNLAHRHDDAFIDELARKGIAYVPFFPLGGFTPLQSSTLSDVASRIRRHAHAGRPRVAAAPIAQPLVDPGTSSRRPPPREPGRRGTHTVAGHPGGVGRHRRRGKSRSAALNHRATCRTFNSFWPRISSLPSTRARGAQLSPCSSTTALASGLKPEGLGSTRYSFVLLSVVSSTPSASTDPPRTNGGCWSVFIDLAVHGHRDKAIAAPLIV